MASRVDCACVRGIEGEGEGVGGDGVGVELSTCRASSCRMSGGAITQVVRVQPPSPSPHTHALSL
jgi:hypothetical protein